MRYLIFISLVVLVIGGCNSTKPTSKFQQMMSEVAKSQEQMKKNTEGKNAATKVNSYYCLSSEEYTNTSMGRFEDTFSMKDEALDVKSKIIKHVPPRYPSKAARNNIEGYVTSSVVIDEQGCYVNIKVIESYPKGVFDQSVIYALKGWKSSPALIDGKPVKVKDTIRLDFQMPKKSAPKSKMEIDLEKLAVEKLKGL